MSLPSREDQKLVGQIGAQLNLLSIPLLLIMLPIQGIAKPESHERYMTGLRIGGGTIGVETEGQRHGILIWGGRLGYAVRRNLVVDCESNAGYAFYQDLVWGAGDPRV